MKLSLALALNLALLATAAPTALRSKRADGQETSPDADLTSKIAYGSLKSAAQMMNMDMDSDSKEDADFGNNTPVSMTPNEMTSFPGADGSGPEKPTVKKPQEPTPAEDKDEEEDEEESKPTSTSSSASSSSSAVKPSSRPSASDNDEGDDAVEEKKTKKPAADESEEAEASSTPSAAAEKPKPKNDNPFSNLPVVGEIAGGLLGGL
ncbi:hypothetical protein BJX64DRAFT_206124 [Aspergillus heterothallicus]